MARLHYCLTALLAQYVYYLEHTHFIFTFQLPISRFGRNVTLKKQHPNPYQLSYCSSWFLGLTRVIVAVSTHSHCCGREWQLTLNAGWKSVIL